MTKHSSQIQQLLNSPIRQEHEYTDCIHSREVILPTKCIQSKTVWDVNSFKYDQQLHLIVRYCCGKWSLMKTQTRILDNRKELHRKGEKSRTVRITPILICGICCMPHLTGKCGTRAFFLWVRAQGHSPHAPGISQKCLRPRRHSPY